ncbi:MAG: diguanylate cyclase [Rhodoferax sp.]|nr:diguanylate cyclase [Rhodoferax sp.]MCF8208296.1 diguanylate cyclase [Rhodoferax sp.]
MNVHIPTMFWVTIMVGAVLSVSVAVIAHRKQRDGLLYWALGLAFHTVSYVVIIQRDNVGVFWALVLGYALRAAAWASFAEGLCEFYRRRPPRVLIWTPVVAVIFLFSFFVKDTTARILVISLVFAVQCTFALWFVWQARLTAPGRGKYFMMTGLVIAIVTLLLRALGATRGGAADMASLTGSNPSQTLSLFMALGVILMLSIGFVLMSKDRADDMNRVLATQDDLTGLANRRRLNEVFFNEWARSQRSGHPLALAMIDIDQFKNYNDHYGHQAGDLCLKSVAQVIQSAAGRAGDLAARYGGEEFVLILPDTDAKAAHRLAEGLRAAVQGMSLVHAKSSGGTVSVSIGVAALEDGCYADADALLQAADQALYRAKNGGRNQVVLAPEAEKQRTRAAPLRLVQLVWRSVYETGDPVIDTQHRALFALVNQLLGAMLEGREKAEVAKLIEAFLVDIARHFHDEEAILRAADVPDVVGHAVLHQALLDKSATLALRFRAGTLSIGELFEYLAHEVVARHILSADREMFAALKRQK